MRKYNSICTGRIASHGDPASTDAAAPGFKKWLAEGMPDPIPEELIVAFMKNCQTSRAKAVKSCELFRREKQASNSRRRRLESAAA